MTRTRPLERLTASDLFLLLWEDYGWSTDIGGVGGGGGVLAGEGGQRGAVDDLAVRRVALHGQCAGIHPAPDGVVADTEEPGGLGDAELRHDGNLSAADADLSTAAALRGWWRRPGGSAHDH